MITAKAAPPPNARPKPVPPGSWYDAVTRLGARVERMATQLIPTVLAFRTIPGTVVDNPAWLAVLDVTGTVAAAVLFRKWLAAALPLTSYLLLLAVWTWMMERYYTPIISLLFLTMLLGASSMAARIAPR